ncbi:MAG: hypothetical protein NVSMB31_16450 [Vulcanimicrobiaceae bacterium]
MKKAIQRLAGAMLLLAAFQALAIRTASADQQVFLPADLEVNAQRYGVLITLHRGRECPNYQCRDTANDLVLSREPSGAYFPHTIHPNNFSNGKVQISDVDISLKGTYTYKVCDPGSDYGCSAGVSVTIHPLVFSPLNVQAVTSVDKPSLANLTWTNKGDAAPIRIDRYGPHDGSGFYGGMMPERSWSIPAGTTHYEDTGLEGGERYFYKICAIVDLKDLWVQPQGNLVPNSYDYCTDSNRFEAYPPPPQAPQNVAAKYGSFGQSGVCVGCKKTATSPNVSITWDKSDKFTEWFEVERFDSGSWRLASLRQNPALTTFLDRAYETRVQGWNWRVCAGNITGRTCSTPVTLGNLIKTLPIFRQP